MNISNIFKKREKIKVIYDEDIENYLLSLGVYNDLKNKKLSCDSCGTIITIENLYIILPKENKVALLCSNPKCIKNYKL